MRSETQDSVRAQAITWHVRLRDGDDETWDAFAQWLAEDPSHAAAYDLIEDADLAIEPLLPEIIFSEAANDAEAPTGRSRPLFRRWGLVAGALAASIVAAVAIVPLFASSRYDVVTAPGQRRVVALDAATQVELNGATRMTFDRSNPRFAALGAGEALIRVRHDSARPFRLEVGSDRIEDVGTVFNVVRDAGEVRVAVAEGRVVYNPGTGGVPLNAGQALVYRAGAGTVRVVSVPVNAVGAWLNGRLVYAGEPMSQVAADLGRSLGIHIAVAPSIADRPFSGAIVLDGSGIAQLGRLSLALNVALEPAPDGWTMKPLDSAK